MNDIEYIARLRSPGVSAAELHEDIKVPTLFGIVKFYSDTIENGRTVRTIFHHAETEMRELYTEMRLVEEGEPEGKDGIVGEAIDNMLCHMDIAFKHKPEITESEFMAIVSRKCAKWAKKYADKPSFVDYSVPPNQEE